MHKETTGMTLGIQPAELTTGGDEPGTAPRRLRWQWIDLAAMGLILAAVAIAAYQLWQPGIQNPGDMLMSVYRVFELQEALGRGVLFPRMGPNLNFTLGSPMFQFYPPLVSYGALLFHYLGMGYIGATKAMLTLNMLSAGLGIYCYLRWLTGRRLGAVTAGILFVFAPYLLLVIYERGAAAESTALAVLPWLLWTTHRLLYDRRFWAMCAAAVFVALAMLSHNITALFVVPSVMLYVGILGALRRDWGALARAGGALALGLGVSAFYWLPALTELRFTKAETFMLGEATDVRTWLTQASQVVQHTLIANYTGYVNDDRFRFAQWMAILGVIGAVTIPWQNRRLRPNAILLTAAWIAILLLQTEWAFAFWDTMPLVRFLQFPWRLFGLASLSIVLVLGMLLSGDRASRLPRWAQSLAAGALILVTAVTSTANLRVESLPIWVPFDEEQISITDLFERGRNHFPLYSDYTPMWMDVHGPGIVMPRPLEEIQRVEDMPAPAITVNRIVRNGFDLGVRSERPFTLTVPRAYFPGWQAYVDGARVETVANGQMGLVAAEIPAGEHQVQVQFDQTPIRTAADLISIAALAIMLLGSIFWSPLPHKGIWLAAAGVLMLGGGLFASQYANLRAVQPPAYGANLDNEVQILAYEIQPQQVAAGDSLAVRLFWYLQKAPLDDRKVFIHLVTPDDTARVAQLDQYPLLGNIATTRLEAGQIFVDEYHVPVPEDVAPGTYSLLVGMYHPDPLQNLPILSGPNTLPGDRMLLTQIEVVDGR